MLNIILIIIAAILVISVSVFHIRYIRFKSKIESVRSLVNHDLRSPLNAILGFADLLLQSEKDEEKTKFISAIKSGGNSILAIIEDVGVQIKNKSKIRIATKDLPAADDDDRTEFSGTAGYGLNVHEPLIMIVDDLMNNVIYLEQILKKSGFRTISALNGNAALNLLTEYTPDLILLDIVMPGMDGFETCTRIQNNRDFIDIPVIFLSAKKDEQTIINSFIYGGIDYIVKPFNSPELLARVNTHIQLKSAKEKLHKLAYTDTLTGIFNRRKFIETLESERARALRYGENLSLIMIDIDHFKKINDNYGHDIGDKALIRFSNILKTSLRETDFPGRLGGEEFGILLPETNLEQTVIVAERIRKRLETESQNNEEGIPAFTASFGIAQFNEKTDGSSLLTREADQALYMAKKTGRNKVCRADNLSYS